MQKSSVLLDTTSIQTLVSPTGKDHQLIRALYLNQYHMTMMSLFRLYEQLLAETPELAKRTDFGRAIETLSTFPTALQRQVIEYPSLSFWVDVAWDMVNRRSHILFPEMHISFHLQDFWRFVLAAALKDGHQHLSCTLRTNSRGLVALPATSTYLEPHVREPYTRFKIRVSGLQLQIWGENNLPVPFTTHTLPLIGPGIELNAIDDDVRLPGRTQADYEELIPETTQRWQQSLTQGWDWIVRASPLLAEEIALGLKIIAPVCSPSADTHLSASYHEAPGLITMSWTADQAVLAEALVHEYHHQKLHALMGLDPLLVGPADIPIYYSPWRTDPRPLRGLLHAAFTFQEILEWYHHLLLAGVLTRTESLLQRLYKCSQQVTLALETLSQYAQFSVLGHALLESLKTNLARQQASMPALSEEGKHHVEALLSAHRQEWERHYGSPVEKLPSLELAPSTVLSSSTPVPEQQKLLEQQVLQALQLPLEFQATVSEMVQDQYDPVLDGILLAKREQRLDSVVALMQGATASSSLLLNLTGAHIAYLSDEYERAAQYYKACLHEQPTNILFWQYYAFVLRHLRQWETSRFILQNLQRLAAPLPEKDGLPTTPDETVETRLAWLRHIDPFVADALPKIAPQEAPSRQDHPFVRFFPEKQLQRFFEFAPTGDQLPSFLAVLHKIKPAMDLWITPHGWDAFQRLVEDLGLVYHVDTYFDPYSKQLEQLSPASFTTTRAALSRTFAEHTQAHIFLSYDLEHLYPAVSSGWYPLVIDGSLIQKHMPDHDKFGEALGYPRCCQHFFGERNDWHSDNTFYAAYRNTPTVPQKLSNGFLRHTMFSLAPYIPCSMDCQATIHYARTLLAIMTAEFPEYAQEVERRLSSPILCLSELRVYRFTGNMINEATVEYSDVERVYESLYTDHLYHLLQQGDCCVVEQNIVRIYKHGQQVATHLARADQHGPEMPFLVRWT
jgi:HEXXH motif-containing protein